MTNNKRILILRHGPSIHAGPVRICSPAGRLKLVGNSMSWLGLPGGSAKIFCAPEWDTRHTAQVITDLVQVAEIEIEPTLSDESDAAVSQEFLGSRLADGSADIFVTHFRRMNDIVAGIEEAAGVRLEIDRSRMRHLNRAYLVDMAKSRVLVIKEKS